MKWISVKEYKPEPYDTVVLFEADKRQLWFGHYDSACDLFVYYFGNEVLENRTFTHWMPLPEFPANTEGGDGN